MIAAVLQVLARARVGLFLEEGRLRFRAPPGAYTAELRALVAEHRIELVAALHAPLPADPRAWPFGWRELYDERAGILEYDAGHPRPEAERLAEEIIRAQYVRTPHDDRAASLLPFDTPSEVTHEQ